MVFLSIESRQRQLYSFSVRSVWQIIVTKTTIQSSSDRDPGMILRSCLGICLAALALHAQARPAEDCAASGTVVNAVTGEPIPKATVTIGVDITGNAHSGA